MTTALLICAIAGVLLILGYLILKEALSAAERASAAEAQLRLQKEESDAIAKATTELVRDRTDDDTAARLRDRTF